MASQEDPESQITISSIHTNLVEFKWNFPSSPCIPHNSDERIVQYTIQNYDLSQHTHSISFNVSLWITLVK